MSGYVMDDELAWIQPFFYSFTTLSLIFNQLAFSIFAKLHAKQVSAAFFCICALKRYRCFSSSVQYYKMSHQGCNKWLRSDVTKTVRSSALRNVTKSVFSTCYLKRDMTPMQRSFITSRLQYWNSVYTNPDWVLILNPHVLQPLNPLNQSRLLNILLLWGKMSKQPSLARDWILAMAVEATQAF